MHCFLLIAGFLVAACAALLLTPPLSGRSPFRPDRDHIHHRAERKFGSHRNAVLVLYLVSGLFGTAAVLLAGANLYVGTLILGAAVALIYLLLVKLDYLSGRVRSEQGATNGRRGPARALRHQKSLRGLQSPPRAWLPAAHEGDGREGKREGRRGKRDDFNRHDAKDVIASTH